MKQTLSLIAISLFFTHASFAQPSAGVFLFINTVTNNSGNQAIGHQDETELTSVAGGEILPVTIGGGGGGVNPPVVSDFIFTKNFDRSSLRLKNLLYRAISNQDAEIRYYNGVSNTPVYVILLDNFFVSSFSTSNADCAGNCPGLSESISLTPALSITWRNLAVTPNQVLTYNRATNTISGSGL